MSTVCFVLCDCVHVCVCVLVCTFVCVCVFECITVVVWTFFLALQVFCLYVIFLIL